MLISNDVLNKKLFFITWFTSVSYLSATLTKLIYLKQNIMAISNHFPLHLAHESGSSNKRHPLLVIVNWWIKTSQWLSRFIPAQTQDRRYRFSIVLIKRKTWAFSCMRKDRDFNNLSTSRTVIHNTSWLRSSNKEKGLSYHKFQKLTEESIAFNMLIMLMIVEKITEG